MAFPYIFTFYSFKGGVGRTMAAANVAYALASRGRNVLLLDMDLEAPGLSTFFHKSKEITEKSPLDVLDLLGWAQDWARTHPGGDPDFDAIAKEGPNLGAYTVRVPDEKVPHPRLGETGRLDLLLVDPDRDYLRRFEELHLPDLSRDLLVRISRTLWGYFKSRRFPREVPEYYGLAAQPEDPYDYVLVDSRTGYTEIGALCIGPLADRLVVLTGLNVQNVEGTADFLKTVGVTKVREESDKPHDEADAPPSDPNAPPRLGPKPTLLVASPVPIGETRLKYAQLKALQKRMNLPVATTLTYHPLHAVRETVFVRDLQGEYLAMEYKELADRLMGMVKDHAAQLADGSTRAWREGQKAAAIEALVRLTPHEPNIGGSLLTQISDLLEPSSHEEFVAADRLYHILASESLEGRWPRVGRWGQVLQQWANKTDENQLRIARLNEALHRFSEIIASQDAPHDQKQKALMWRGAAYEDRGDLDRAIGDFTTVIEDSTVPVLDKAYARFDRSLVYEKRGDLPNAIGDYTSVIGDPAAPPEVKATALWNRSVLKRASGDKAGAMADVSAVLNIPEAPAGPKADALVTHAEMKRSAGDPTGAISDASAVLDMPDAPPELKARALIVRAMAKGKAGDTLGQIADYTAVVDMPEAGAEEKAKALFNRGAAKGQAGDRKGEIADYNAVIEMPDAPAEPKAAALYNRGSRKDEIGDTQGEIADCSAVLQMPGAPGEQRAKALLNRGLAKGKVRDTQGEIADYTAILDMPDAPGELRAHALAHRGMAKQQAGDTQGAIADYSLVIHDSDADTDFRARAYGNVGALRYAAGDLDGCVQASEQAIALAPGLSQAHSNLGLALLRLGRTEEALREYETAIRGIGDTAELERAVVSDLRQAMQAVDDLPGAEAVLEMVKQRKREIEAARHSG